MSGLYGCIITTSHDYVIRNCYDFSGKIEIGNIVRVRRKFRLQVP